MPKMVWRCGTLFCSTIIFLMSFQASTFSGQSRVSRASIFPRTYRGLVIILSIFNCSRKV